MILAVPKIITRQSHEDNFAQTFWCEIVGATLVVARTLLRDCGSSPQ